MRQLNEKLLLSEQEFREMKLEMLKEKGQNEEPSKGENGHSHGETQGGENGRCKHRVRGGGECRMHSQQNIWGDENNEDDEDIWQLQDIYKKLNQVETRLSTLERQVGAMKQSVDWLTDEKLVADEANSDKTMDEDSESDSTDNFSENVVDDASNM
ncbi:uncharacterized protein LOC114289568 isoform X1 [Camellia sinensis]|uniref:uncharacterized protein LOC114289568 isoform X1 n=1 Tax=Camellia sinensis TaxID=4442 RepID=UPI001035F242|nr:uncharacterized protein LOC114289568 isoform X1 [Camellia sinensis]XP_028089124.1 uncharacterized protein LOC114289568 isoform X1 [Camellia sinensis]XP_028089130.1 uncharacterized protein LOC114289568 isoform X1 [Camellia sinensis]XP_028089137.1 uncharacterized protein LOC114289568 isoform X1 [Camellia sinensis]